MASYLKVPISSDNSLRDKHVRSTRFEIINTGTSGTVTLPANSTVVLDDFGGTVDAVVSQVSGGKPLVQSAETAGGEIIATSFDTAGNWVLTGTPSAYPIAIIYRVRQSFIDFDSTASNIWGQVNNESTGPQGPAGQGVPTGGTVNQALVKSSSTDYDTTWADVVLSASYIPKTKTANQTTTSTTQVDVTDMFFPIGANETWIFEFSLFNGCDNTGGLRYMLDVPAGAAFMAEVDGTTSGHNVRGGCRLTGDDTDPAAPSFNTVTSTGGFTKVWGTVVNGATAGNVQLRYRSATAGQTSTIYQHSTMWARKVS